MDFKVNRPIYQQIVDYCYNHILTGQWLPDSKIPSVRELAVALSVNTHTVLKALETLQDELIIAPRRGLGFFLAPDARERVMQARRREFFDTTLAEAFAEMDMLGVTIEQVVDRYRGRQVAN